MHKNFVASGLPHCDSWTTSSGRSGAGHSRHNCYVEILCQRYAIVIRRHNLSTYGCRAFSVTGPAAWNCLSDELREPLLTANSFRQLVKTRLFAEYYCIQRIRGITHYALHKSTYLLTLL